MDEILRLFPKGIKDDLKTKISNRWPSLQEIRIRINQPIELIFDESVEWMDVVKPNNSDKMYIVNKLSEFSLYRMEDELKQGYITITGGHRIGLAGKVNTSNGTVKAIKYITFLNIRLAKQKIGIAEKIMPFLRDKNYLNTLIIGAPQTGKTTLLRDIIRIISSGQGNIIPQKTAVIDERSEIAASLKGIPQHDLGMRTDILDACPKAEGMMMMIRSMSPQVLVADEIGSFYDVESLLEAISAGVTVICTVHGRTIKEITQRPSIEPLVNKDVFKRFIILDYDGKPGVIKHIYDSEKRKLY